MTMFVVTKTTMYTGVDGKPLVHTVVAGVFDTEFEAIDFMEFMSKESIDCDGFNKYLACNNADKSFVEFTGLDDIYYKYECSGIDVKLEMKPKEDVSW